MKQQSTKSSGRNKILSITQNVIPFIKELRRLPLIKSVTACILMQQLDYWFEKYPNGFYKFLEPCEQAACKVDSWTEELGFSADEFRTAFDQIGVRYKSKKDYIAAENKFQDRGGQVKYYCSYNDRVRRMTYYFRNHAVVEAALNSLGSTEVEESNLYNSAKPISRDGQRQALEAGNAKPDYKENNKDTNQDISLSTTVNCNDRTEFNGVDADYSLPNPNLLGAVSPCCPVPDDKPVALPAGFAADLESLLWAVRRFPRKSPEMATESFVEFYTQGVGQGQKKASQCWQAEWRKWMQNEREVKGYSEGLLEEEHDRIWRRVLNLVYLTVNESSHSLYHRDWLYAVLCKEEYRFTEDDINECLNRLVDYGYLSAFFVDYYCVAKKFVNTEWQDQNLAQAVYGSSNEITEALNRFIEENSPVHRDEIRQKYPQEYHDSIDAYLQGGIEAEGLSQIKNYYCDLDKYFGDESYREKVVNRLAELNLTAPPLELESFDPSKLELSAAHVD